MKLDSLNKRLRALEPDQSMKDSAFLGKLTDKELDRLEDGVGLLKERAAS